MNHDLLNQQANQVAPPLQAFFLPGVPDGPPCFQYAEDLTRLDCRKFRLHSLYLGFDNVFGLRELLPVEQTRGIVLNEVLGPLLQELVTLQ